MKFNRIFFAITGLALLAVTASAQPYYTNVLNGATNGNFAGAQTPYQTLPQRYLPSATMAAQGAAGISSGTFAPGVALTNAWPTNVTYTTPPVVTATGNLNGTNVVSISLVTTTGFTLSTGVTNGLTIYWIAIGH